MTDRAYARISLDTAASGSITKQRRSLAKAGDDPVFYVDESVSGSKVPFADRPEGGRLLADLRKGDRVLVTKIDRAARNVRDLLGLVEVIEERGASIVFVDQNIDTAGPMGRFILVLLAAIAQLEADIIAERRRESLAAFRAEGRHAVGDAPFGLVAVPNPEGRGLVLRPHPEEAPALRDAVERLFDGEPLSGLARDLGILDTRLGRVLRNERLAGILEQTPEGPRMDPDMAVFSLVEWDRLQAHLARPVKSWARDEGIGPALECAVCGERLYRQNSKRNPAYSTYKCRGVRGHEGGESAASVIVGNAEAHVEALFTEALGHLPMTETVTESDDTVRAEALVLARMRVDAARAAQDAAQTEEEEDNADAAYKAARRALREAEAVPLSTFSYVRETGLTWGDVYRRGGSDRVDVLRTAGKWIVSPGRLPIAEKVVFEPDPAL